MKPWEIHLFPVEKQRLHPGVIISNDERCRNDDPEYVNALICTSAK